MESTAALVTFIVISAVMAGMNWRVVGMLDANMSQPIDGLVQGHMAVLRSVRRRLGSSAFMIGIEVIGFLLSLENATAILVFSASINLVITIILVFKAKSLVGRGRSA